MHLPDTLEACQEALKAARALLTLAGYDPRNSDERRSGSMTSRQPPTDVLFVVWNEASDDRPLAFMSFVGEGAWEAANTYYGMKRIQWSEVFLLAPLPPASDEDCRQWRLVRYTQGRTREEELLAEIERLRGELDAAERTRDEIPRHIRITLEGMERAFRDGTWRTLATINEDLQPVADAAIAAIRREQQKRSTFIPPEDYAVAVLSAYVNGNGDGWSAEIRDRWLASPQRRKLCKCAGEALILQLEARRDQGEVP